MRRELADANRSADTLNHYRSVVRGIFGRAPSSPVHAWAWTPQKVESEGKLQFYTTEQVRMLLAKAHSPLDEPLYTLATEAGPRLSEIRGLKVANVDFQVGRSALQDGFTTNGGRAGKKGRLVRSRPMTANVPAALWPYSQARPATRWCSSTTGNRASRSAAPGPTDGS